MTTTNKPSTVDDTDSSQNPLDNRISRLEKSHEAVKNYTIAAMTVGFIPVPLIDVAALTGIQLKMLHHIAKHYDLPFSKNLVKSVLSSLLGGSVAVSLALPLGSLFKAVPIIGQTSGVISTSAIGSASTYAVGKVFIAHFESGGTFLTFNADKAKEHFKAFYEEGKDFITNQKAEEVATAKS